MKTAEGWYQLAQGWHDILDTIEPAELTVFEEELLKQLTEHLRDMEDTEIVPCSPGCPGVAVFEADFEPPRGWVHIERCDDCGRFRNDESAAWSLTRTIMYICTECDEYAQRPLTEAEADRHNHDCMRVIIREEDACKAENAGKKIGYKGPS